MKIYPVIHFLDFQTAMSELALAKSTGADGAFLINHAGEEDVPELLNAALLFKAANGSFEVGINLLSHSAQTAAELTAANGLDMIWADQMGVSSSGLTPMGRDLVQFGKDHPHIKMFASVAFKYQPAELDPPLAARLAKTSGFIPTTSGDATGLPPDVFKVASMSVAAGGSLAVASGMTPDNIAEYAPLISHVLVATGISKDEYRMDEAKLAQLIRNARG